MYHGTPYGTERGEEGSKLEREAERKRMREGWKYEKREKEKTKEGKRERITIKVCFLRQIPLCVLFKQYPTKKMD